MAYESSYKNIENQKRSISVSVTEISFSVKPKRSGVSLNSSLGSLEIRTYGPTLRQKQLITLDMGRVVRRAWVGNPIEDRVFYGHGCCMLWCSSGELSDIVPLLRARRHGISVGRYAK